MKYTNEENIENSIKALIVSTLTEKGYSIKLKHKNTDELLEIAKKVLEIDDEESIILLAKLRG